MEASALKKTKLSPYAGCCFVIPTKHAKSIAIAIALHFAEILGAGVVEYIVDTDTLGTFSGEVERKGNALECAKEKCLLSNNRLNKDLVLTLASEGSFGPHPKMPFIPCNHEVLYLIDKKYDFHLHVSHSSTNTNYCMQTINSLEELHKFATKALFPSHALILRPNDRVCTTFIYKGISNSEELEQIFAKCKAISNDSKVWVETDMRAHVNPTRMSVISELALKLAKRLESLCPKCSIPGWGQVDHEKGLPCRECGLATEAVKSKTLSCIKCDHIESLAIACAEKLAEPEFCFNCNP